jgi:hypothetical protein
VDGFDELRKQLVDMGYEASLVDEVLAQMRAEEEMEARRSATVQVDAQANHDDG